MEEKIMNFEIQKDKWSKFFDSLSKRRFEWKTEVEVLNSRIGDQTLSISLPLNGVTVENIGEGVTIDISVGDPTGSHQTHNIKDPTRIAFLLAEASRGDVVAIEEADGTKTLIRFVEPARLLLGFTEIEIVAAAAA